MRRLLPLAGALCGLALAVSWAARGQGGPESLDPALLVKRLLETRLGREVSWSDTVLSWSPPALAVSRFSVAGASAAAPPAVAGGATRLSLDLAALSEGRLAFDPLTVSEATLQLGRGVTLDLRDLRARAEARGPDGPILYSAKGALASGGSLAAEGRSELAGPASARVELSGVQLAPWRPWLPRVSDLAGRADGLVLWSAGGEAAESLSVELELGELRAQLRDIQLEGPVGLRAELAPLVSGSGPGRFTLDAHRAAMRYAQVYEKLAGVPARVEGSLRRGADGEIVLDELRVRIGEPSEP